MRPPTALLLPPETNALADDRVMAPVLLPTNPPAAETWPSAMTAPLARDPVIDAEGVGSPFEPARPPATASRASAVTVPLTLTLAIVPVLSPASAPSLALAAHAVTLSLMSERLLTLPLLTPSKPTNGAPELMNRLEIVWPLPFNVPEKVPIGTKPLAGFQRPDGLVSSLMSMSPESE